MSDRPILFSAPMVRAILEGRKTQTRRIINPQPTRSLISEHADKWILDWVKVDDGSTWKCPYGKKGDRLWVRETWQNVPDCDGGYYIYGADYNAEDFQKVKWKPSIHMPKKVCRLWLEITNVRVERLQDISEKDAIAEGIELKKQNNSTFYKVYDKGDMWQDDPIWSFRSLWESINGTGSWDANPWAWVVEFTKV